MKILAIETSCDETAAAVVANNNGDIKVLSNIVSSQINLHKKFGGVFPEIASRAHVEKIISVVDQALAAASVDQASACNKLDDIDVISVTAGPGLIGSLLVGVNTAKTLAFANNKPIIPINHWLGHIYSCFSTMEQLNNPAIPRFPLLALIVSGGHTGLVFMKSHTEYETIGQTLDDATGEAFDKVAKILGLGYPGGPAIAAAAAKFLISKSEFLNKSQISNNKFLNIQFPRSMLDREGFDFSFSGLKTSVLYKVKELSKRYTLNAIRCVVAHEFQQTVIDILIGKTLKAAEKYQPKSILLCGGVSANKELRSQMESAVKSLISNISFHIPPLSLTTDNAAMIGIAAAYQITNGIKPTTYDKINADSNLKLG